MGLMVPWFLPLFEEIYMLNSVFIVVNVCSDFLIIFTYNCCHFSMYYGYISLFLIVLNRLGELVLVLFFFLSSILVKYCLAISYQVVSELSVFYWNSIYLNHGG